MQKSSNRFVLGVFVALNAMVTTGFAAEIEEVIVTAQKRAQSLQEVPISVAALTANDLDGLSLTDRADITQQIPNFQLNTWSPNLTTLNIRGVSQNNFVDINEAPIAVYIDDVYMGSMNGISGQLFDMERIEVLRGPQGTLFGRNATGGLVHYLSRTASDDEINAFVNLDGGSFGALNTSAGIGGSFGDPRYRWRVALARASSDGYIEPANSADITAPNVNPSGYLGGVDSLSSRVNLQFDITDNTTLSFGYSNSNDDETPTGGYSFLPFGDSSTSHIPSEWIPVARNILEDPSLSDADAIAFLRNAFFTGHPDGTRTGVGGEMVTPNLAYDGNFMNDGFVPIDGQGLTTFRGDSPNPHTNYADYPGYLDRNVNNGNFKALYSDDNNNNFTYIAAFTQLKKFYTEDGDGIPARIINFTTSMNYTQMSQEARFDKSTQAGHHYVVGLYWLDIDYVGQAITVGAPVLNEIGSFLDEGIAASDPTANQDFDLSTSNYSLFAEGDFQITDSFNIVVGGRFTADSKSIDYRRNLTNANQAITDPDSLFNADRDFDDLNYTARLIFNLTLDDEENHNLYLSLNRGLKSGGFNANSTVNENTIEYDAEILFSYELGYKAALARDILLNAAVFIYDYQDYQAFSIRNGTPNISNANAVSSGLELEFKYTPGNFILSYGLAYLSSDVDGIQGIDEQTPPGGLPNINLPIDTLNDKDLPNAPSISSNLLLAYNFHIGNANNLILQLDGVMYGDQYLEVTNGAGSFQESYSVINMSIAWRSAFGGSEDHSFEAKLFAKNLTDSVYKLYNLDLGLLGSTAYYAPPLSVGFAVSYGFR